MCWPVRAAVHGRCAASTSEPDGRAGLSPRRQLKGPFERSERTEGPFSRFRDLDDPALFRCFEHRDTRQALDDHGTTPHVRAFLNEFGPVIERWESHHTVGLS